MFSARSLFDDALKAMASLEIKCEIQQRLSPEPAAALLRKAKLDANARQRPILVLFGASW